MIQGINRSTFNRGDWQDGFSITKIKLLKEQRMLILKLMVPGSWYEGLEAKSRFSVIVPYTN
jgi:hypothetical protein